MNAALLALALAAGPTLTIDQALILAKQNPQIAQAQGALMQAQGQIGVARSGFLPSASASASVFGTTLNPGLQANDTFYPLYGSSVTLSQTLWDFGRTLGAYQAARDVERSARFDVENTWQQVELNVRTSYYVVLATQALVNVAQQTVDSNQKKLDLAKGLFEVGQRPRFDVTKAEVDLENSRISLLQAKNGVVLSRIALTQAIGRDVNDATLVFPELPPPEQPDVPSLLHTAMENRPDLKSVDLQILAAGETLDSLRSGWLPILGASATVRWNGTDTPLVNNWTAGATLTWPFLNGGAVLGRAESQTGVIAQVKAGRDSVAAPDPHRRGAGRGHAGRVPGSPRRGEDARGPGQGEPGTGQRPLPGGAGHHHRALRRPDLLLQCAGTGGEGRLRSGHRLGAAQEGDGAVVGAGRLRGPTSPRRTSRQPLPRRRRRRPSARAGPDR